MGVGRGYDTAGVVIFQVVGVTIIIIVDAPPLPPGYEYWV